MTGFSFNFPPPSSSSSDPSISIFSSTTTTPLFSTGSTTPLTTTKPFIFNKDPNSLKIFPDPATSPVISTQPTDSSRVKASSQLPQQASAQSNGVDDNKQQTPKTADEELISKNSPLEQIGSKTGIPESVEKLVQTKATDNGARTGEGKNSSPTESSGMSDKFTYTRILRGVTHNPHFTALQSYSKRAREKMIVGWDELFEETIDNIQSLTANTFSANVHELRKTIAELEDLGYNVARLNKRLDELTDVMDKRDSSEREISDLKAKAQNYKEEKKKLETDIASLQAQAKNAQVMVDELTERVDKMEGNQPTIDALFENLAMNPL